MSGNVCCPVVLPGPLPGPSGEVYWPGRSGEGRLAPSVGPVRWPKVIWAKVVWPGRSGEVVCRRSFGRRSFGPVGLARLFGRAGLAKVVWARWLVLACKADVVSTTIAGLLAEPNRRLVAAAVMLGAGSHAELLRMTGLDGRDITVALDRLVANGLVEVDGDVITLIEARISEEARQVVPKTPGVIVPAEDAERAAVIRNFFRDGRLTQIPMQAKKRRVIFDVLAQRFEPGQLYSEARVNLELGQVHRDTAALRRGMVDEEFLGRRDGFYWRIGGTVEIPATDPTIPHRVDLDAVNLETDSEWGSK